MNAAFDDIYVKVCSPNSTKILLLLLLPVPPWFQWILLKQQIHLLPILRNLIQQRPTDSFMGLSLGSSNHCLCNSYFSFLFEAFLSLLSWVLLKQMFQISKIPDRQILCIEIFIIKAIFFFFFGLNDNSLCKAFIDFDWNECKQLTSTFENIYVRVCFLKWV